MFDFLLVLYAETLFFIEDKQTQIVKFYVGRQQPVRSNNKIYFALCKPCQRFGLLFRCFETVQLFNSYAEIFKPFKSGIEVLFRQNRARTHQNRLFSAEHA